jgi:uncharacterized membrane protein YczE
MKQFYNRLLLLTWGLFLYALGIVVTLNANVGYAPWEMFHVGLAKTMGISIGIASIIVGVIIGIIAVFLGEKLGFGTILNMVLIGIFLDIILQFKIIPIAYNMIVGIAMLIVGLFIIALATYYYIKSGFGAGPRDSLMVALTRKTGLPVGACRGIIELMAVCVGWMLGGLLGIGTMISAFAIGFCIQITFKWLAFDATEVKHETLNQTYKVFIGSTEIQVCTEEAPKN